MIISVLSLAISDSFSESYGLYLSKKAEDIKDITKGPLLSMSFLIPLLFSKSLKIFKNLTWVIGWSILLLFILDYNLCNMRNESFCAYFIPHIIVLFLVIYFTRFFSNWLK